MTCTDIASHIVKTLRSTSIISNRYRSEGPCYVGCSCTWVVYFPGFIIFSYGSMLIVSPHCSAIVCFLDISWWRHQMETFSAFLAFCAGNSPANSPHKGQRRGALMFSLICALNKRLSKQSWDWWFETPSRSLWRYCNVLAITWQVGFIMSPRHL